MRRAKVQESNHRVEATAVPVVVVTAVVLAGAAPLVTNPQSMDGLAGAIVKIVPPRRLTPEERVASVREMRAAGATHVWFAPAVNGSRVVTEKAAEPRASETVREAIAAMLRDGRFIDRARVAEVIADALDQEGA